MSKGSTAKVCRVRKIVEKPKPGKAPSNLAVVGRYVLTPAIFAHLERIGQGAGGEIQLTDGIARLMKTQSVYAYRFEGKRYDCGNKLGYLQATVEYGLNHSTLGGPFRDYLLELMTPADSTPRDDSERHYGRVRSRQPQWQALRSCCYCWCCATSG